MPFISKAKTRRDGKFIQDFRTGKCDAYILLCVYEDGREGPLIMKTGDAAAPCAVILWRVEEEGQAFCALPSDPPRRLKQMSIDEANDLVNNYRERGLPVAGFATVTAVSTDISPSGMHITADSFSRGERRSNSHFKAFLRDLKARLRGR